MGRKLFVLLAMTVLASSIPAESKTHGPSTPQERARALDYIQSLEQNPMAKDSLEKRIWLTEVRNLHHPLGETDALLQAVLSHRILLQALDVVERTGPLLRVGRCMHLRFGGDRRRQYGHSKQYKEF